jgi:hypothetical protein
MEGEPIIASPAPLQHGMLNKYGASGIVARMKATRTLCLALLLGTCSSPYSQTLDLDLAKEQARAAVEKLDAEKPLPESTRPLSATPQQQAWERFQKDIVRAGELAPPRAGEAPKIEEIIDPGGYGRRVYRVIGAAGTYCITYESNHAPDGLDSMANGIKPKITTCPKDGQPATTQPGL